MLKLQSLTVCVHYSGAERRLPIHFQWNRALTLAYAPTMPYTSVNARFHWKWIGSRRSAPLRCSGHAPLVTTILNMGHFRQKVALQATPQFDNFLFFYICLLHFPTMKYTKHRSKQDNMQMLKQKQGTDRTIQTLQTKKIQKIIYITKKKLWSVARHNTSVNASVYIFGKCTSWTYRKGSHI